MSTELGDLEALLLKVLPDPRGYTERVLAELAERLATPPGSPTVVAAGAPAVDEALADRMVLLVAALGACECWGEDSDCTECSGRGSAGWMPPDPALYDEYVRPAVLPGAGAQKEEPIERGGTR
jgi:hypothetical protein